MGDNESQIGTMISGQTTGCLVLLIGCLWLVGSNRAEALESLWVGLEAYRVFAPVCPGQVERALGTIPLSSLNEPIQVIRKRETEFTARVKTGGDLIKADEAIESFRAVIARQILDAVTKLGCDNAMKSVGLLRDKPLELEKLKAAAATIPLPTTERDETKIPRRIASVRWRPIPSNKSS